MHSQLPSSVRIYATAYRSMTLPCDADFCWEALSPVASIASWGCTIVERCDIDERDPTVRAIHLVPATPGTTVLIREKLVKLERTPAGEKGTIVFENLDAGAASPFPVRIVEMQTSLSVSKITTLTSPLGRTFAEMRASFVVCSVEDAAAMKSFLESSLFDPLLHCAAEMLVPIHPFRDAMFHSVMRHFEDSMEKLVGAAALVRSMDCRKVSAGVSSSAASIRGDVAAADNESNSSKNVKPPLEDPISVSHFAASAISVAQELYAAWLETSRELRRVEKKIEDDENARLNEQVANGKLSDSQRHHMSANYEPAAQKPSSARSKTIDVVHLNNNNLAFGHNFEFSTPGTYVVSSPIAARMMQPTPATHSLLSAVATNPLTESLLRKKMDRGAATSSVVMPMPAGWEQEIFDDAADDVIAEDNGQICDGRGEILAQAPVPPPRRVLGGR